MTAPRTALTLAYLRNHDLGEIVVRQGERVIERRYFRMSDLRFQAAMRAAGETLERQGFRPVPSLPGRDGGEA